MCTRFDFPLSIGVTNGGVAMPAGPQPYAWQWLLWLDCGLNVLCGGYHAETFSAHCCGVAMTRSGTPHGGWLTGCSAGSRTPARAPTAT